MSVEKYSKLETYKGIKNKFEGIEKFFFDLKFNKKNAKYDYHSGLVAGMMIRDLSILQPIIEQKKEIDKDLGAKILEQLMPKAKSLVEDYNWNLLDLENLIHQFFGEEGK